MGELHLILQEYLNLTIERIKGHGKPPRAMLSKNNRKWRKIFGRMEEEIAEKEESNWVRAQFMSYPELDCFIRWNRPYPLPYVMVGERARQNWKTYTERKKTTVVYDAVLPKRITACVENDIYFLSLCQDKDYFYHAEVGNISVWFLAAMQKTKKELPRGLRSSIMAEVEQVRRICNWNLQLGELLEHLGQAISM